MKRYWQAIWVIWRKDMALEQRSRELFIGMGVFVLLSGIMFSFALDTQAAIMAQVFPGLLWLSVFFGGSIAIGRTFAVEQQQQALSGLRLAPIEPSAIFFGKSLANLTVLLAIQAVGVPAFLILFEVKPVDWPALLASVAVSTFGFALLATFLAALTAPARGRAILLPLLLLPIGSPLLLGAVQTTAAAVGGEGGPNVILWYRLLYVYATIFSVLPFLLFDYILEE